MKSKRNILNNQGAVLLFVICCVAMIGLIGSVLLIRTTNARDMETQERKAKETFYVAESGSKDMVSALEQISQDAVKIAFADLMVDYGSVDSEEDRKERYAEVFKEVLVTKLTEEKAAQNLIRSALNLPLKENNEAYNDDDLNVKVSFDSSKLETGTYDASTDTDMNIRLNGVTFSYTENGSQTNITTDIVINTTIPTVGKAMTNGVLCKFQDFVLISGGDLINPATNDSSQVKKVVGNTFVENNLQIAGHLVNVVFENSGKLLVKGNLIVDNGAKLKVTNSNLSSGYGLWARNILLDNGGKLEVKANTYVRDDLSMAGNETKAYFYGSDNDLLPVSYVGYNGLSARTSENNSAITINSGKKMILDMSGLERLMLRGNSYILEKKMLSEGDENSENLLGILQGESVAYKDMQSMYLVPSELLKTGQNPMTKIAYDKLPEDYKTNMLVDNIEFQYQDETGNYQMFPLYSYLSPSKKYVMRTTVISTSGEKFVYFYLNFESQSAAARYFKEYMKTSRGRQIQEQIKNLDASKILLAKANYTFANAFRYDYESATGYTTIDSTTDTITLSSETEKAKSRYNGLFSMFRFDALTIIDDSYDVIGNSIVDYTELIKAPSSLSVSSFSGGPEGQCVFAVKNGDLTVNTEVSNLLSGKKGILLVNGVVDFATATNFEFEGLIIGTKGVILNCKMTLTNNEAVVDQLLTEETVAKYFQGFGSGTRSSDTFVSSESVSISFENWNRNK